MTTQPNFLFIITDQHRADWLGCMGHPVVKTPNIDALAARGTAFTDFHVAAPVCMPNRASLMTGRMPSVHGLRHNGYALPERANTFVDVLRKAGYDTALIGKSHLQPFTEDAPRLPPQPEGRLIAEAWKDHGEDHGKEEPDRYRASERYEFPTPYYGFDHVDMVTSHGDKCGGHYQQWFRQNYPDWEALHDRSNELPHDYTCAQGYRTPIPEEGYPTAWIGARGVDYLKGRKGKETPFFAFVSFPDPHHPFNPPGKYWDMYSPDQFEVSLPYEAHQNPTPSMQNLSDRFEQGLTPPTLQSPYRATDQHVKEAMALTAGMISMIDDQVGLLIEALKESGQYDNTVIIFTSDHGDYLGDFNLMLKGPLSFRGVTHVPMIWADPAGTKGARSDALASTIDIGASILDRVGEVPYNGFQGRSFLPVIQKGADHREDVFVEHHDGMARAGFKLAARVRTLITKTHRFTFYKGEDWGELYDLQSDPRETRNLWNDPAHAAVQAEMAMRLMTHLADQTDQSPLPNRLA